MKNRTTSYVVVSVLIWLVVVGASAYWNFTQTMYSQREAYLESGRSLFNLIRITREWNALHGGVYLHVTSEIQPNPYLDVPKRDITTTTGEELTLINPAYMTRLIAELALTENKVQFHITSLKPIRPGNAPAAWESPVLESFEKNGVQEYFNFEKDGGTEIFRYMAPLVTQESCLPCHAKQGYQVGDIRGGISITFPVSFQTPWALTISHIILALVGGGLILKYGTQLGKNLRVLEDLSNVDGLTQIPNRRFFDEFICREHGHSRRNKTPLSVAIADVDDFKAFNDAYGHLAGDNCLKQIALELSSVVKRSTDLVARCGGEEFYIILPNTPLEGALAIGEEMLAKVRALKIPHRPGTTGDVVTISLGITIYTGEEIGVNEVLNLADQALYQAKSRGKNRVECRLYKPA